MPWTRLLSATMNTFLNTPFTQDVKCGLSAQPTGGWFSGASITSCLTCWLVKAAEGAPEPPMLAKARAAISPAPPRVAVMYQAWIGWVTVFSALRVTGW